MRHVSASPLLVTVLDAITHACKPPKPPIPAWSLTLQYTTQSSTPCTSDWPAHIHGCVLTWKWTFATHPFLTPTPLANDTVCTGTPHSSARAFHRPLPQHQPTQIAPLPYTALQALECIACTTQKTYDHSVQHFCALGSPCERELAQPAPKKVCM